MYENFEDFLLSKKYDFFDVGWLVLVWVTRSGESGVDIFFADGYRWSGDGDDIFGMTDGFLGMS